MMKRYILYLLVCLVASTVHSQEWTAKDSVNLNRILNGNEEIKLNPEAVKSIDFGSGVGAPLMSTEKQWMLPDETLPSALPDAVPLEMKKMLTLRPYKPDTPYNWDPVNQRQFKVDKDTWRGDPFYYLKTLKKYTNWAKTPVDAGERSSLAEIEATGLRYNPLAERSNGMAVGAWQTRNGPTGMDLMTPFTKDFWDRKGRIRRARTLEVLKSYGDSTTIFIPHPVLTPIVR